MGPAIQSGQGCLTSIQKDEQFSRDERELIYVHFYIKLVAAE